MSTALALMGALDLLGDDDELFSGDDDDETGAEELIGALFGKKKKKTAMSAPNKKAAAQAAVLKAVLGQKGIIQTKPKFARVWPLPLGRNVDVPDGDTTTLTNTTQRLMKIKRLLLSSADLQTWMVLQIVMGIANQQSAVGAGPAEAYQFNAISTELDGNTIEAGQDAAVLAQNFAGGDSTISGAIYGLSAE